MDERQDKGKICRGKAEQQVVMKGRTMHRSPKACGGCVHGGFVLQEVLQPRLSSAEPAQLIDRGRTAATMHGMHRPSGVMKGGGGRGNQHMFFEYFISFAGHK